MARSLGSARRAGMQATSERLALLSQGPAAVSAGNGGVEISSTWRPEPTSRRAPRWRVGHTRSAPAAFPAGRGYSGVLSAPRPAIPRSLPACGPRRRQGPRPSPSAGRRSGRASAPAPVATASNSSDVIPSRRCASSRPSFSCPGLRARILERPARDVAHPERPHELEAGQSRKLGGVPLTKGRVGGPLPGDRVLDDRVAEVVDDRGDGEDAAQPLVQTLVASWSVLLARAEPGPRTGVESVRLRRRATGYARLSRADRLAGRAERGSEARAALITAQWQ